MKTSIWNILTVVVLLGTLILCVVFGVMLSGNKGPASSMPPTSTPFKIPTATNTPEGVFPPTWTPPAQPQETKVESVTKVRATSTIQPTSTTFTLPTFTAVRPTYRPVGCEVVSQEPKDNTNMTKGATFKTTWQLKNISNKIWSASSIDIRYVGGDLSTSAASLMDMPYDIGLTGIFEFSVTLTAPTTPGTYTSR